MEALQHIPISENPNLFPEFIHLKTDIPDLPPLIREDDTPQSDAGIMVSEEEYWKNYYEHPDFRYEWNNGILEVKSVGDFASYVQSEFFYMLMKESVKTSKMAILVGLDIGFKLVLPEKKSIRKPDLAVILKSNPVQIEPEHCTYKGCFDMCIEFLSDTDKKGLENDTVVKKLEYSQAGVKEYFILDRNKTETAFYRLNSKGKYKKIKSRNGIIDSQVLPGFKFRIDDLYSQPPLEELIKDEVYQPYVLISYQEQIQKTEEERLKVEKERLKAEKERSKAKKERLRAEKESLRAKRESLRAEKERHRAEKAEMAIEAERKKAEQERLRAEQAEQKAQKLTAKLQALLEKNAKNG